MDEKNDELEDSAFYDEYKDSRSEYFYFVRLAFRIKPEDVYFLCRSEPADLSRRLLSETKIEQVIQGYSDVLCNKEVLRERIYERQPFANKLFESQKFFIHIKEEPKDDQLPRLRPHGLSIYYDHKKQCHTTFRWKISDRSFFTRLLNSINAGKTFTFVVFLREKDEFFRQYAEDPTVELPKYLAVEGLTFTLH